MQMRHLLLPLLLTSGPAGAAENLDAALSELATEVLSYFEAAPPKKIAIATMVHGDGTCSDLSERASDKFQGELFRVKDAQTSVIDRRSLSAIFREQELVEDGTISPTGAAKIAAVEQVDAIVTGKMTQYGDDLEFVVSMLDAVSGTVVGFADSGFRLSSRDEAMLAAKSPARCGFVSATGSRPRLPADSAIVPPDSQEGETDRNSFSSDVFSAEVVSLFYARETGKVTFTLRFTNRSEKVLDISLNPKVLSIQDNKGGVLSLEGEVSGLAVCTDYRFCYRSKQGAVTTIASGTKAQLNFTAAGQPEIDDLGLSLTFEVYLTADAEGEPASKVVSVGFFDLVPVVR